jgi:hypothetical protein
MGKAGSQSFHIVRGPGSGIVAPKGLSLMSQDFLGLILILGLVFPFCITTSGRTSGLTP